MENKFKIGDEVIVYNGRYDKYGVKIDYIRRYFSKINWKNVEDCKLVKIYKIMRELT